MFSLQFTKYSLQFTVCCTVLLGGVLLGSLGGPLASSSVTRWHCGASAGVYSLLSATLASLILNWTEEAHNFLKEDKDVMNSGTRPVHMPSYLRMARVVFIVSFAILDTGFAIYNHNNKAYDNTGYLSHFMGAIGGLLLGWESSSII